jgi:hypothetical protein
MVKILIDVDDISHVLQYYDRIKIYRSSTEEGSYTEITDVNTRIVLEVGITKYYYDDPAGTSALWYKTAYFKEPSGPEADKSNALQGGTEEEKIGYTFGNYGPPAEEWGEIYTPDDVRYTMLFGIDCIGSDIAQSEFTDEQFKQIVREATGEFEAFLTTDIRRRSYKTFNTVDAPRGSLTRARFWREGVDFTDIDQPYDFDPRYWKEYGFIQLRHWPVISVSRAIWYSPVKSQIMDMIENDWIREYGEFGQLRMFPKGGFSFGPYSVYGPLWTGMGAARYPGGFEFDYETGYESADFVPEGLRSTIGKYATIKALAVVGDGLLAGFSSQSISLDGLSESFSSTQSATSIHGSTVVHGFGRIDEMYENRKKLIGQNILSMNRETGDLEPKKILDVVRHPVNDKRLYRIFVPGGTNIIVTEDHSLFDNKMNTIKGESIESGDRLTMMYGVATVIDVFELNGKEEFVYDLSVEENENFIANGFVCHNSAYFGARIKQYSDEIKDWLEKNRYKYAPIPMSFVGAE